MIEQDLPVAWHPQGFIALEPFRAHRELIEAGYRVVPDHAAADPQDRPAGALRLYAKAGRMYWLVRDDD